MGSIVQGIQFSFIRCKSSGELLHSIVPIVNNILYIVYMPESKRREMLGRNPEGFYKRINM